MSRIDLSSEVRKDCLLASAGQSNAYSKLSHSHVSVTGGTGFLGTWIAETIAALNDEYQLNVKLDIYARNISEWRQKYPHLAQRQDINCISQDVRSPFSFSKETNFVIHAAGIPSSRVHASDPLRVFQTTVDGANNAMQAASELNNLLRFLNISSGLVCGRQAQTGPTAESDCAAMPSGQLHLTYVDAKRAAESLGAIYRNQFRLPITTIRPFTFAGPFQSLEGPWAMNNFIRDALKGVDIRIHGDGSARRSYLYGSDAAWWAIAALINGEDGGVYNLGSPSAVTMKELAIQIEKRGDGKSRIVVNTVASSNQGVDDFFPDTTAAQRVLCVKQTCSLDHIVDKTWNWFSLK